METGIRLFLLTRLFRLGVIACAAIALQGCGLFGGSKKEPPPLGAEVETQPGPDASEQPVINPEVQRRTIKVPTIHSQDFEFTVYGGIMSIEDFGTNPSYGARIAYHVTEAFFLEGTLGQSKGGTTSYERLAGSVPLLSDDDRKYSFWALNVGWDALPGEIFIGKGKAYNSAFYVTGGAGFTEFGGDNRFTANAGVGYRVLFTRSFAAHFDFRDYLFDIDLLGEKKIAHNLEGSLGLSFYF
jgi:outer membrane beta-barrel protein